MKRETKSKKRYIAVLAIVAVIVLAISVISPVLAYYIRTADKSGDTFTSAPPSDPNFGGVGVTDTQSIRLFATRDGNAEANTIKNVYIGVKDEGYPVYVRVAVMITWQRLAPCECEGCEIAPKGCEKCENGDVVCTEKKDCDVCDDDCEKCKIYPKCKDCADDCVNCSDCKKCEENCARCKLSIDCCSRCEQCQENCMPKDENDEGDTDNDNEPTTKDDSESTGSDTDPEDPQDPEEETEPPYCARCNGETDTHFITPKLDVDYKLDLNIVKNNESDDSGENGANNATWVENTVKKDKDGNFIGDNFYYYMPSLTNRADKDKNGLFMTDIFINSLEWIDPQSNEEEPNEGEAEGEQDTTDNDESAKSTWPGEGWYLNIEFVVQTVQAIGFTDPVDKNGNAQAVVPAWKDAWPNAPWGDVWGILKQN